MERKEILTKTHEGVLVANSQLNKQLTKIKGALTSRIEVKPSSDIPAYGFFKIEEKEYPVIFRIKDEIDKWLKPIIKKGSQCELEGEWKTSKIAKSIRPSFTAYSYQILQEPKPLTTSELITLTSGLLSTTLEKYKEWTNRKDFLFKKLEELKEIETLSKLGEKFLQAYLTLKQASYANYQTKLLATNFDLTHYLTNISQEIQLVKSHIEAYQAKQLNYEQK